MNIITRMPAVLALVMMSSAACSSSLGVPSLSSLPAQNITPFAAEPSIQPSTVVTISSSSEFQPIPLQPASYSETVATSSSIAPAYLPPSLPSYSSPASPSNLEFGVPMSDADYILQPVIPSPPADFSATLSSQDKLVMITAIARTIEYHPVSSLRGLWAGKTVYGTTFSDHPLVAR